jgi:basic amino acid/polyamine antiporter, APA family
MSEKSATSATVSTDPYKYTRRTAIAMVMANMIGTGVFTSLGYQSFPFPGGIPDGFAILILWFVGGIISLCGATVYAEISTTLKESGGEYVFLSKIYHRSLGFVSGWVSLFVGFGSAIALSAIALGQYGGPVFGISSDTSFLVGGYEIQHYKLISIVAVLIVSSIHLRGVRTGGIIQNYLTYFKITLILVFCVLPFIATDFVPSATTFTPSANSFDMIFSVSFAGSLVWVMLAYSGWNASAYIAGNLENPKKNLPYSLITGTIIVMVLYILLNLVFMYVADFNELAGKTDVGNEIIMILFGPEAQVIFSGIFSVALLSTMSAMVIAGPRVYEQMGKDYSVFSTLAKKGKGGTPVYAILLQAVIAILLVIFSSFAQMVNYISLTLMIFSSLTIAGIFILRKKYKDSERPVRAFLYPLTPIVFLLSSVWIMYYFASSEPASLIYTGLTILSGFVLYIWAEYRSVKK